MLGLRLGLGLGSGNRNRYAGYELAIDFQRDHYQVGGSRYASIQAMPGYSAGATPDIQADGYHVAAADTLRVSAPGLTGDMLWMFDAVMPVGAAAVQIVSDWTVAVGDSRVVPLREADGDFGFYLIRPVTGEYIPISLVRNTGAVRVLLGVYSRGAAVGIAIRGPGTVAAGNIENAAYGMPPSDTLLIGHGRGAGFPGGEAPITGGVVNRITCQLGTFTNEQIDAAMVRALG